MPTPHHEAWTGKRVDRASGFDKRAAAVLGARAEELLAGVETTLARMSQTYGILAREVDGVRIFTLTTEPTSFCPAAVVYFVEDATTVTLLDIIQALPDDPGL